jgi:hypothetical protein
MRFAVAIRAEVDDAQINPQRSIDFGWCWFVNRARRQEVKRAVAIDQIRFTLSGLEQRHCRSAVTKGMCFKRPATVQSDTVRWSS